MTGCATLVLAKLVADVGTTNIAPPNINEDIKMLIVLPKSGIKAANPTVKVVKVIARPAQGCDST